MNKTISKYRKPLLLLSGVSTLALAMPAYAQDAEDGGDDDDVIVVTGIRGSLKASLDVKRDARGVVDAITAEDIGKFPDTNLAESLQRIPGVSINRALGEGSQVTVRGFGPDFNLVLLNGRQMPSAFLTGGAPASRSFDFGNIASEAIAGVQVYKTGRAAIPTGGIGSTLNILTTRPLEDPGTKVSIGAKLVLDKSVTTLSSQTVTPEFSGIFSTTFADDRIGIAVSASYQDREAGLAQVGTTSGWRGAYLGSENNWGTLPQIPDGESAHPRITNRPGPNDVYSTPQNINYQLSSFNRKRFNGQAVLQFKPVENMTISLDYFYTRQTIDVDRADLSVWFNHGNVTSAWTDGPIADPIFYNEDFGDGGSDLSMGAGRSGSLSINRSFGANMEWEVTDSLSFEVDFHTSSAQSGQNSPFGTAGVASTADFQLRSQNVNFENEIPVLVLGFQDPHTDIDASRMTATGSTFQNSFIRTDIDQLQFNGKYEFDSDFISSVDFGATYTRNQVRSAFANNQSDTWGGVGNAADLPDDIFRRIDLASNFNRFSGHEMTQQDFFVYDIDRWVEYVNGVDGRCNPPRSAAAGVCRPDNFITDRRIDEKSWAGFAEITLDFELGAMPVQIVGGVRYENTNIVSPAIVTVPTGSAWVAENEFTLIGLDDTGNATTQEFDGSYEYWLPAIDLQFDIIEDLKFRASYSHTLTRPGYGEIAGGLSVDQLFRVNGGSGTNGNTNLRPFVSRNVDASLEWYYSPDSYVAVGFFYKNVSNFIARGVVEQEPFDVVTPFGGERYNAAVAAVGSENANAIRQWIFEQALDPNGAVDASTVEITRGPDGEPMLDSNGNLQGRILGVAGEDPTLSFRISIPVNQDTFKVHGWEFSLQHVFGDTGFGLAANYTIVNGDVSFVNERPASGDPQVALVGLSNSYNLVGFYDKHGVQVRVAWNNRGQFLSSTTGVSGTPNNPLYVEPYGQLDFTASYEVLEGLTVFVDGINILNAKSRTVGRSPGYVNFANQTGPRYVFGVRYSF